MVPSAARDDAARARTLGSKIMLRLVVYCVLVAAIPIYAERVFRGDFGVGTFPYPCAAAALQLGAAGMLLVLLHLALRALKGTCSASARSQDSW